MMRMRGVAAALMTLEVGLVAGYAALHALVRLVGGDPFRPSQGVLYFLVALLLALPGAAFAGAAAVREAADPDRRLLWVAALAAGLSALTWALFRFDYGVGFQSNAGPLEHAVIRALQWTQQERHGVGVPVFVNVHQPPAWFLLTLPAAVFAAVVGSGRRSLARRAAEERAAGDGGEEAV